MSTLCERLQHLLVERGPTALKKDDEAQQHLVECTTCFAFMEALWEVDKVLPAMPETDASDALVARTLAAIGAPVAAPSATTPLQTAGEPEQASRLRRLARWLISMLGRAIRLPMRLLGLAGRAVRWAWMLVTLDWLRRRLPEGRWKKLMRPLYVVPAMSTVFVLGLGTIMTLTLVMRGGVPVAALAMADDFARLDMPSEMSASPRDQVGALRGPAPEKTKSAKQAEVKEKFSRLFGKGGEQGAGSMLGGGGGRLSGTLSEVVADPSSVEDAKEFGADMPIEEPMPDTEPVPVATPMPSSVMPITPGRVRLQVQDGRDYNEVDRQIAVEGGEHALNLLAKVESKKKRKSERFRQEAPEEAQKGQYRRGNRADETRHEPPPPPAKSPQRPKPHLYSGKPADEIVELEKEREMDNKPWSREKSGSKRDAQRQIALESGVLSMLSSNSDTSELGYLLDKEIAAGEDAPLGEEDFDGFQDDDGRPDPDMDFDEVLDEEGAINGDMVGDSNGLAGLGIRGSGPGGGGLGNSLGIGGIGTSRGIAGIGTAGRAGGGDMAYGSGVGIGGKRSRSTLSLSTPVIMGALPKEVIQKVIAQNRNQIRYCYEIELQRSADLAGKIKVKWIIAASGAVPRVMITESTVNNRNVESCIAAKIKHWKFPAPAGGGIVEVSYPFIFRSSGGSVKPPAPPTAARLFLDERASVEGLKFKEATGYWKNTYVPGDPSMRLLHSRLDQRDRDTVLAGVASGLRLDDAARQYAQPFDVPTNSALAVFLHSDRRYAQGRTRALVQIGIKGTPRYSGSRPAMNLGVVLDMRKPVSGETGAAIRALVNALGRARDTGDRFSLIVAGKPGGVMVPADSFKYGPLTVAMQQLFNDESQGVTLSLATAVQTAITTVVGADDPSTPLGSSVVLLVTPNDLSDNVRLLRTMAYDSAVNGVPMSVVGVGSGINLEQLDAITLAGQGNRRLLSTAAEARPLVDRELSAVSRVIARAVRLRIRLAPGVELVDVIGSFRLDEARAEMVRQAEQSIDRRISRNLGLQSDRGEDEEGIQIVIPSYYAGDTHVVLLDVVLPDYGPVADVRVRYKDLVFLRNGVSRANLSVERYPRVAGPLELNVLKNFVARRLSSALTKAGEQVAAGNEVAAIQIIAEQLELLRTLRLEIPGLTSDRDILADIRMLGEYQQTVLTRVVEAPERRAYIADSLRFAGFLKVLPRPLEN